MENLQPREPSRKFSKPTIKILRDFTSIILLKKMEEKKNKRPIIVGIFVCIGLAILIATIFTLGGQRKTFVKKISLTTVFKDINGLKEGDNVWFSGVKIGTVKKITLKGN